MALIFIGDNDLHGRYTGEEHLLAEGLLGIERDVGGHAGQNLAKSGSGSRGAWVLLSSDRDYGWTRSPFLAGSEIQ